MRHTLLLASLALALPLTLLAAQNTPAPAASPAAAKPVLSSGPVSFDFKDPKGVNGFMFMLDSPLEPFFGTGSGISGMVDFDVAHPEKIKGELAMESRTLKMTNERMTGVLHGADWLDVEKFPSVSVKLVNVTKVSSTSDGAWIVDAVCDVTIKDKTKQMPVSVRATLLPGRLGDRMKGASGDLLVLRANFTVSRADFAIKPDMTGDVVADQIQITAAVAGYRKSA